MSYVAQIFPVGEEVHTADHHAVTHGSFLFGEIDRWHGAPVRRMLAAERLRILA